MFLEVVPDVFDPVCGSDGKTYKNKFNFEIHSCELAKEGTLINIECDGFCPCGKLFIGYWPLNWYPNSVS